ncbi:MAG TPA: alpha/beta hydrolase [Streptosporangiaceae bacterium]|nr:alpha/beta hydrolase [Streptosporangiaceae bacterium]
MRRAIAAVLGAAVAVAGLVGCTSSVATPPTAGSSSADSGAAGGGAAGAAPVTTGSPRLTWHTCPVLTVGGPPPARMRCASLQVPLNYADPGGRKITLALSEIPATAPPAERQGVLLVNPGGPGASGLSFATTVATGLAPSVAKDYDIVGFDTRGVGASNPALSCEPGFFSRPRPNYVPATAAAEQVLVNRARQYAAACERRYGWLLPYMTTEDLARDMDSIRVALGQRQISYYGVSYGTYLGQVYATLFPHQVRRMVLDSVVDPDGVWYADNISQDYAFQGRINAFFSWIARYNSVYHLGDSQAAVNATFTRVMARLAVHPISGKSGPLIGPDELSDTILIGGYSNEWWPYLAAALSAYVRTGSGAELIPLYQQIGKQGENEFAVYTAVECADAAWPRSWAYWNTDTRKVYARAPFETWGNTWFNAACAFWPVKGHAKPLHIDGTGLPPVLMLQGTLDAATPYAGALVARKLLPSARLVVVQGGGNHGQSLSYPPNNCVNGYLNRYLADGSLPGSAGLVNATCPALPPPSDTGP